MRYIIKLIKMGKFTKYKKIALYGTGLPTREFILNYSSLPIYGILDKKRVDGFLEGYPIMSLEKAINDQVDVIIVLASITNEKTIYDRISNICRKNSIAIVDRFENNLMDIFENNFWGYSSEEDISLEVLEAELLNHDVISFDIFDTLLMRMTLTPEDVFDMVDYRIKAKGLNVLDFKINRIFAERKAIENHNHTLDGIYSELQQQLNLSMEDCSFIKAEEVNVEKDVIVPRRKIIELFYKAKTLNKKIYLVSDMYLPESVLEELLQANGISGYDGLFISGFEGASKYDGLFNVMKNRAQGHNYLHIGDNKVVDGLAARFYGIDAFIIPSAASLLYKYTPYMVFATSTINERLLLGLYISIKYNDPFVKIVEGKIDKITIFDFCRCFIAPLVTVFMIWLLNKISNSRHNKVLFAARDGYIFYKLYKKYNLSRHFEALPEGVYFFTSRKAAINSSLNSEADIKIIKDRIGGDIINKIFKDGVSDNQTAIKKSKKYRDNYIKYMSRNEIDLSNDAFVDLVSSGTSQFYLQKGLNKIISGYYLARLVGVNPETMNVKSMMFKTGTDVDFYNVNEVFILENILTSPDPSLVCFDDAGEPVFDSNTKNENQLSWLQECFNGIEDFYATYVNKLYIPSVPLRAELGGMLFFSHHNVSEKTENELFYAVSFVDNLINKVMNKNG